MEKTLLLSLTVLFLSACSQPTPKTDKNIAINSFEECVAMGNSITDYYPEQCKTKDGLIFLRKSDSPKAPCAKEGEFISDVANIGPYECCEGLAENFDPSQGESARCQKPKNNIPKNCTNWFDGCNNCGTKDGELIMCTLMYCENPTKPKCLKFQDDTTENPAKIEPQDDVTPIACTMDYTPVCGTPYICLVSKFSKGNIPLECQYGKTYSNKCMMKGSNAVFRHDGECKKSEPKEFSEIPQNCTNWFDGCNNCKVMSDGGLACTKMACPENRGKPKCTKFKE